jgi:hypothetical protein
MTKADELNALADRCEREEASLDLDGAIAIACERPFFKPARYTTSLDAAVTLVPEGMEWTITHKNRDLDRPSVFVGRSLDWSSEDASTPALALCAAALRARASLLPAKEGE